MCPVHEASAGPDRGVALGHVGQHDNDPIGLHSGHEVGPPNGAHQAIGHDVGNRADLGYAVHRVDPQGQERDRLPVRPGHLQSAAERASPGERLEAAGGRVGEPFRWHPGDQLTTPRVQQRRRGVDGDAMLAGTVQCDGARGAALPVAEHEHAEGFGVHQRDDDGVTDLHLVQPRPQRMGIAVAQVDRPRVHRQPGGHQRTELVRRRCLVGGEVIALQGDPGNGLVGWRDEQRLGPHGAHGRCEPARDASDHRFRVAGAAGPPEDVVDHLGRHDGAVSASGGTRCGHTEQPEDGNDDQQLPHWHPALTRLRRASAILPTARSPNQTPLAVSPGAGAWPPGRARARRAWCVGPVLCVDVPPGSPGLLAPAGNGSTSCGELHVTRCPDHERSVTSS